MNSSVMSSTDERFMNALGHANETFSDGDILHLDMFETGGEEGSSFHIFNDSPTHYHRSEVLQRTGAIDISCGLKKVVHGALAPESDQYATLMVMQWFFKPQKNGRRITEATIGLRFSSQGGAGNIELKGISMNESYHLLPTIQNETVTTGVDASIGGEYGSMAGKVEKTVESQIPDAVRVSGGMYVIGNRGPRREARWTLRENASDSSGVPASLTVAVLVARDDEEEFFCDLALDCKTDIQTAAGNLFRRIPKDDPIILQPDPRKRSTSRDMGNVSYGDEQLGSIDLDKLGEVTFATVLTNAMKTRSD